MFQFLRDAAFSGLTMASCIWTIFSLSVIAVWCIKDIRKGKKDKKTEIVEHHIQTMPPEEMIKAIGRRVCNEFMSGTWY